jgi:hypothetical protein
MVYKVDSKERKNLFHEGKGVSCALIGKQLFEAENLRDVIQERATKRHTPVKSW